MQRCHAKHALAGQLERRHLNHHRQCFDHKYATHDDEHDLLPADHRNQTQRAAERQCADVAHEDFCRIRVEPKERQPRAGDGAAEHRKFTGTGDVRYTKVGGKNFVAGDIGKDGQR